MHESIICIINTKAHPSTWTSCVIHYLVLFVAAEYICAPTHASATVAPGFKDLLRGLQISAVGF